MIYIQACIYRGDYAKSLLRAYTPTHMCLGLVIHPLTDCWIPFKAGFWMILGTEHLLLDGTVSLDSNDTSQCHMTFILAYEMFEKRKAQKCINVDRCIILIAAGQDISIMVRSLSGQV